MIAYQCPLCTSLLELQTNGKQYICLNRHNFDMAKEGYINLLPVQHKHSLEPGDNKPMLVARRAFLTAGYYSKLAETIATIITNHYLSQQPLQVLDLGCGEGYYCRSLAELLHDKIPITLHGVDIAKFAIAAAAKKQTDAYFAVASNQRLPYVDAYFDVVLRIFAPSNAEELKRVLKASGLLLIVTPGPRHLWQLKEFIYADVKAHTLEPDITAGFTSIATERVQYQISPDSEHRLALLHMTPFAWRANLDMQQALGAIEELVVDIDFVLTLAKKCETTTLNPDASAAPRQKLA